MHNVEEIFAFVKAESSLADEEVKHHFSHLEIKFKDFLSKLEMEDEQTKVAFQLIVQSAFNGHQLTQGEKIEIAAQLKELLKTAGLVALTVLPGGTVILILSSFLKLNPYILPAVFLSKA